MSLFCLLRVRSKFFLFVLRNGCNSCNSKLEHFLCAHIHESLLVSSFHSVRYQEHRDCTLTYKPISLQLIVVL